VQNYTALYMIDPSYSGNYSGIHITMNVKNQVFANAWAIMSSSDLIEPGPIDDQ
jgi:hypothetical protein